MKKYVISTFLILILLFSGCVVNNSFNSSKKPFELKIITLNEKSITDMGKFKKVTNVEYEIFYNSDISVTSCEFIFVSEDGIEYEIADLMSNMIYQKCKGTHMAGVKQKYISNIYSIGNQSGTFYVNLWSNEVEDMHYKRYSSSYKYN